MRRDASLSHCEGYLWLPGLHGDLPESEDRIEVVRLDLQHAAVQLTSVVQLPGLLALPREAEGFLNDRIKCR